MTVDDRLPEVDPATFFSVDIRAGTVLTCEEFPDARRPAYKLSIDLGPLGVVRSSARVVDHYTPHELVGMQVLCVANFPPRQIGPVRSEVLVLGVYESGSERVVLLRPDKRVRNGDRVG